MHRSKLEKVCDTIAYMQTSLGEATQWVLSLMCIAVAGMILVRSMVAA